MLTKFSFIKGPLTFIAAYKGQKNLLNNGMVNPFETALYSTVVNPTASWLEYLLEQGPASYTHSVELVDINLLKPHEEIVSVERVEDLKQATIGWDCYKEPLLVDRHTYAILDGHHRYTVGALLGLKRLPVVMVDYLEDHDISVDCWPECGLDQLTKEEVVLMSLSDNLFPPKTSRHSFSDSLPSINIPLESLRKC